jgi:4-diphosphocytidyl-2-C-methyl-D-erythritol kinase
LARAARNGVVLKSPAKINLFLCVVGKLASGYHEIKSLMVPLAFCDRVTVTPIENPSSGPLIKVSCPYPGVPEDSSNLAVRAAEVFFKALGTKHSLSISIEKQIPPGAGLGGGSSNAAAVLKACNSIFKNPFSTEKLAQMAANLGADVPFFVYGVPALASGIGERITPVHWVEPEPLVVVFPGVSVPTAQVYKKLTLTLTTCGKIHNLPTLKNRPAPLEDLVANDLEAVAAADFPQITKARLLLEQAGARAACMTGSGSAVFGLFASQSQAQQATGRIAGLCPQWSAWATHIAVQGKTP